MPKRGALALALTTLALVLLLSFKTPTDSTATSNGTGTVGGVAVAQRPAATTSPTTRPASGGTSASRATPRPTTGTTSVAGSGSYTGSLVGTRFGDVQVQVTIENGQITDVQALQLPANDFRSTQISQRVEARLRSSALAAQSAQIDLVSGATYTSMAYARSLQAALDQAGG